MVGSGSVDRPVAYDDSYDSGTSGCPATANCALRSMDTVNGNVAGCSNRIGTPWVVLIETRGVRRGEGGLAKPASGLASIALD